MFTVRQIKQGNRELHYFNHAVRVLRQNPREAWEDATNMEKGEYPGTLPQARRKLAPWHYSYDTDTLEGN